MHVHKSALASMTSPNHVAMQAENPSSSSSTCPAMGSSATAFTLFPELPIEIRLKIWRHALPGSRVIGTCLERRYSISDTWHLQQKYMSIRHRSLLSCKTPVPLFVCQESRNEALRFYQLRHVLGFTQKPVYIDFSRDIIYLEDLQEDSPSARITVHNLANLLEDGNRSAIQFLAMDSDFYSLLYERCRNDLQALQEFTNLKEFILVKHFRGCKDNWTENNPQMTLVEADDPQTRAEYATFRTHVLAIIEEIMQNDHTWERPVVTIKSLLNGGIRCCEHPQVVWRRDQEIVSRLKN